MLRIRRYRYFVVLATIALFLFYRSTTGGEQLGSHAFPGDLDAGTRVFLERKGRQKATREGAEAGTEPLPPPRKEASDSKQVPIQNDASKDTTTTDRKDTTTGHKDTTTGRKDATVGHKEAATPVNISIPNRKRPQGDSKPGEDGEGLVPKPDPTTATHWSKPTEHFPVPPGNIISLPSATPVSIPKIQFDFPAETDEARSKRVTRLAKVRTEMKRAWQGYKEHAWMHDELSPVSGGSRDPFCGWAATLVDALDTLWIMDLKDEFEYAVKAVGKIDFTTAQRADIPVFETTIRYLGGLLAAYDVSGGHAGGHKILLDKAVELGEVLMGVFDTPNRMPVLYYKWSPEHTWQAKRARSGISIAELGSLSMEFTRLAQLTKENKYYDAVARITDALEDWQNRGTTIHGIFPERVDATGCNATAAADAARARDKAALERLEGSLPASGDKAGIKDDLDPKSSTSGSSMGQNQKSGFVPIPGARKGAPSDGESRGFQLHALNRRAPVEDPNTVPGSTIVATKLQPQMLSKPQALEGTSLPEMYQKLMSHPELAAMPYTVAELGADVCYPQGLTASGDRSQNYGMGGSQDSTYEYIPKQFLLLGGLVPKYETMYNQIAKAVKKWLLYRPMVPGDRDILFSGKATTRGQPEKDLQMHYEVTHLTCFLGGMFGMAGKIFGSKEDVEIGKKLADGCVWAYESTRSGIMPEEALVVPCEDASNCHWNETLWRQALDPSWEGRERRIKEYLARQKDREVERQEREEELRKKAAEKAAEAAAATAELARTAKAATSEGKEGVDAVSADDGARSKAAAQGMVGTPSLRKRDVDAGESEGVVGRASEDTSTSTAAADTVAKAPKLSVSSDGNGNVAKVGGPVRGDAASGAGQVPLSEESYGFPGDRPLTHEEFVETRIKDGIPPSFVKVNSASYILRPEAIESVWYMYRITGDAAWQDKGWKMFESIVAATQAAHGHSAVGDVLSASAGATQTDKMESFWPAETLKYFYLLYSTPDVISLDEWVLNTEAHPFRRPSGGGK